MAGKEITYGDSGGSSSGGKKKGKPRRPANDRSPYASTPLPDDVMKAVIALTQAKGAMFGREGEWDVPVEQHDVSERPVPEDEITYRDVDEPLRSEPLDDNPLIPGTQRYANTQELEKRAMESYLRGGQGASMGPPDRPREYAGFVEGPMVTQLDPSKSLVEQAQDEEEQAQMRRFLTQGDISQMTAPVSYMPPAAGPGARYEAEVGETEFDEPDSMPSRSEQKRERRHKRKDEEKSKKKGKK